jgi:protein-tyrosine phosphatase
MNLTMGNIFSSLFGTGKSNQLDNFSELGVDIHSHFIPGIDDGCKTIEESLSLIRSMKELGFNKLITTPHIMSDYFKNTGAIITEGLMKVREKLAAEQIHIELEAAAEYYLDDTFVKLLGKGNMLTFGKEKYLLLEVSYINYPENFNNMVFDVIVKGYIPVLAHPERYPFWSVKFDEYKRLKDMGVLLQLNITSLSGYYGPDVKRTAEKLAANNMIDFLGSDMHHEKHLAALQKSLSSKTLAALVKGNLLNKKL